MKFIKNVFVYGYVSISAIAFTICIFFFNNTKLNFNLQDIPSISGSFAGFLFTSLSIIISIPNNRFMKPLRKSQLYFNILMSYVVTIIVFIAIIIAALFKLEGNTIISLFITALIETIILTIYLFKIAHYSSRAR